VRRELSMAVGDYAHVRDLADGRVTVEGVDLVVLRLPIEQILQRALRHREWDVSELSLAQYVALRSRGDTTLTAIPVFPSRVFRHGAIYVRRGTLSDPGALNGARVGIPEWVQTAGVWVRGILAEEYGVDLASIAWVQAGVNQAGREEGTPVELPRGLRCHARPDASLDELLQSGEIDAIISARPPASFVRSGGSTVRLMRDHREAERVWWERTGILPIMHIVTIRRDVYGGSRWIARGLLDAFSEAKRRSVAALADPVVSYVPLPWVAEELEMLRGRLAAGDEWWPYGVAPNRATLETFLRYARDQGIAAPQLAVEDLFAPETLSDVRV
jgi:4,5-dihydroxyphthalate decarboxylase